MKYFIFLCIAYSLLFLIVNAAKFNMKVSFYVTTIETTINSINYFLSVNLVIFLSNIKMHTNLKVQKLFTLAWFGDKYFRKKIQTHTGHEIYIYIFYIL